MIKKADLKDWLDEGGRRECERKIEEYIDREIKRNAVAGKFTFLLSTGKYTRNGSVETKFFDLWNCEGLSYENKRIVQNRVIEKYRDFGFTVERTTVDCGWNNFYPAIKFENIDKAIKEDKDDE